MNFARQHGHRTGALSADEITTILRMSAAHATPTEIAKALGRSPVNMGMLVHNVKLRRGGRATIARHIAERGITKVAAGRAAGSVIARSLDFVL